MRIIAFPHRGIAYNDAFYLAVEAAGAEVVTGVWAGRWLLKHLRRDDVVHIHWPSFLYTTGRAGGQTLRHFARFLVLLALTRVKGAQICWTAHNLMPHTRCVVPWLDVLARHIVIFLACRIFVHGTEAQAVLVERFPRSAAKCVRSPHGHWIDHYPRSPTAAHARASLGIPAEAFVYLFFGQCKPYKNLEGLIRVFLQVARDRDVLLVAGIFSDAHYLADIRRLVGDDPRVHLDVRYIPDDEVPLYLAASDVMTMPYREILTSGTAMLALSFGKPVISINRGFLRDVVLPAVGILVEAGDEQGLGHALIDIRKRTFSAEAIVQHARGYRFRDAACIFLTELTRIGKTRSRSPRDSTDPPPA